MEVFSPNPPNWTEIATHAHKFCCPSCHASSQEATTAWINRRSPVLSVDRRKRKWQEFYHCQCGIAWWGWSDERTPNEFADRVPLNSEDESDLDYDSFFGYF
jgi:hypothetical protein